jgi:hypothetical protein
MDERIAGVWLPRLLRAVTLTTAACLLLAVVIAPWAADPAMPSFWTLYAQDVTVRRTSIFSALGLAATAFIFFKSKPAPPKPTKPDPSKNVAGA